MTAGKIEAIKHQNQREWHLIECQTGTLSTRSSLNHVNHLRRSIPVVVDALRLLWPALIKGNRGAASWYSIGEHVMPTLTSNCMVDSPEFKVYTPGDGVPEEKATILPRRQQCKVLGIESRA